MVVKLREVGHAYTTVFGLAYMYSRNAIDMLPNLTTALVLTCLGTLWK